MCIPFDSRLLVEPATLTGLLPPFEYCDDGFTLDCRKPNLPMRDVERFFSSVILMARLSPVGSSNVLVSMKAWGKMPHLPFGFLPDQHQCSK